MNIQKHTVVFRLFEDLSPIDSKDFNIDSDIKHFIADLTGVSIDILRNIKNKFITFDKTISARNGSFIIVSKFLVDDKLKIVPTLQEAYDYIEMEEIERQL